MAHFFYLRRQTVEHPNPSVICSLLIYWQIRYWQIIENFSNLIILWLLFQVSPTVLPVFASPVVLLRIRKVTWKIGVLHQTVIRILFAMLLSVLVYWMSRNDEHFHVLPLSYC